MRVKDTVKDKVTSRDDAMTIQSDYQPVRSGLSVVGSLNTYFQDSQTDGIVERSPEGQMHQTDEATALKWVPRQKA